MEAVLNKFYLKKGLKPYTRICQFISLNNFLNQLMLGKYYIRRKDLFEDVNERTLPTNLLFIPTLANSPQSVNSRDLLDNQTQEFNRFKDLSKSFVSSWTLCDTPQDFMWKIYASSYGVCIVSTIDNFIASFDFGNFKEYEVYCADIEYRKPHYNDKADDLLFVKHPSYASEQELRFLFLPGDTDEERPNLWLPYNCQVMLDQIILSPFLHPQSARFLKACLEEKYCIKTRTSVSP